MGLLIAIVIVFIGTIIVGFTVGVLKSNKENERISEISKQLEKERTEKLNQEKAALQTATDNYGKPSDIAYCSDGYIATFPSAGKILLNTSVLGYKQIIRVSTESEVLLAATADKVEYQTSKNLGSMIGRAAVGAAVAGPMGALAGAVTGKSSTTAKIVEKGQKEVREYIAYITTTDGEIKVQSIDEKNFNHITRILEGVMYHNEQTQQSTMTK